MIQKQAWTIALLSAAFLTVACDKKEAEPAVTPEANTPEVAAPEAADPGAAQPQAAKEEAPTPTAVVKVGEAAPEFMLKDHDGKEHKLSDFKGKIVVLEWTSPGCPYVVRHYKAKTMSETHKALGEDKVVWLAVDSSHFVKSEEAARWRTTEGFNYPVLLDADGAVGRAYHAKTTPHLYVVDAEGVLRYSGAVDDDPRGDKKPGEITNYVTAAVNALVAGEQIKDAETKPYGCSVKYGS